jgi:hypothetical protein
MIEDLLSCLSQIFDHDFIKLVEFLHDLLIGTLRQVHLLVKASNFDHLGALFMNTVGRTIAVQTVHGVNGSAGLACAQENSLVAICALPIRAKDLSIGVSEDRRRGAFRRSNLDLKRWLRGKFRRQVLLCGLLVHRMNDSNA